jgi:hypothetical protein
MCVLMCAYVCLCVLMCVCVCVYVLVCVCVCVHVCDTASSSLDGSGASVSLRAPSVSEASSRDVSTWDV